MKTRNWFNESLLIESVNHFLFYATKLPFARFVHLCIQSMLLPDTRLLSCFTSQRLWLFSPYCAVWHQHKAITTSIRFSVWEPWTSQLNFMGAEPVVVVTLLMWEIIESRLHLQRQRKREKRKENLVETIRLGDIWVLENIVNHTEKTFLSMHHWSHTAITKNSSAVVVTFGAWYATLFASSIQQDYITEWGAEQDLFSLELFLKGTAIFLY